MSDPLAIGVDLGATKIATALLTRGGEVVSTRHTPTLAAEGAAAVIDRIAGEVRALIGLASAGAVQGVGIGSPGLVDAAAGVVRDALNLRWTEVPLAAEVSRRVGGVATYVENDANANALGEGYFGSAKGAGDYLLLTVGSGLGSGVVSGGRIVSGAHNRAADLGHYSLDPDNGPPCPCGHRGCAEMIASGPALPKLYRAAAGATAGAGEVSPAEVLELARQGDPAALGAFRTMARALGHVAAAAGAVSDPAVVVLGGGLGTVAADLLLPGMEAEFYRRVPPTFGEVRFAAATLPSPAVGAASVVFARTP